MRTEEAQWIGEVLSEFTEISISPVLEIGSSTAKFREVIQPHIDKFIHRPMKQRGVEVVHADLKDAPGVDISGDLYDPLVQKDLIAVNAGCLLCCNLLEHVGDRDGFARLCDSLVRPGGILIVSVPRSYPHHLDPIDTGFRPLPEEIARLFPKYRLLRADVVASVTYWDDLLSTGRPFRELLSAILRCAVFWRGWQSWKARAHRFLWLFRRYTVSIAVLSKPNDLPRQS